MSHQDLERDICGQHAEVQVEATGGVVRHPTVDQ